jgi:hypothetical protein
MVSRRASAFSRPLPSAVSASLCQITPSRHGRTFRQSRGGTANSGLRLCVKDGLLQACVLLTTQGDNSRIRWSVSQECQHVLSTDIRPYFKKLLGTSPVFLQEVTLPANFMLRNVSTLAPGFEDGVCLLQGDRRPSTVKSYDQKWLKFEAFTAQVQDDAGAPRMSVLSASSQTVVAYLGYLLESDTISAKSLQSYLSVINAVHNDFEYPPPACGHLVKLARQGFANWPAKALLYYKGLPYCNRSKSPCFQQSTWSPLSTSVFVLTLPSTTFVCARVSRRSSPSSVVLIQVSS